MVELFLNFPFHKLLNFQGKKQVIGSVRITSWIPKSYTWLLKSCMHLGVETQ